MAVYVRKNLRLIDLVRPVKANTIHIARPFVGTHTACGLYMKHFMVFVGDIDSTLLCDECRTAYAKWMRATAKHW